MQHERAVENVQNILETNLSGADVGILKCQVDRRVRKPPVGRDGPLRAGLVLGSGRVDGGDSDRD
jgi:hypothetical protein